MVANYEIKNHSEIRFFSINTSKGHQIWFASAQSFSLQMYVMSGADKTMQSARQTIQAITSSVVSTLGVGKEGNSLVVKRGRTLP